MGATEETNAADAIHLGCGGAVVDSLDGPLCAKCGAELREDEWLALGTPPPNATLDDLRKYAERVSQASGMATVIVAHGSDHQEFVVTRGSLSSYRDDPVIGALVEALKQRLELLDEDAR